MNTHRNRSRTVLAVAALAALSLSLTACNSGEGTKDSGAASTDKAATDSAGSGAENTGSDSGSGTGSSKASGGTVYSAINVYQETKAEDDYFTSIRLSLVRNNSDDSSESVKLVTPGEVEYAGKRADGIEVLSWNTKRPYAG
jgi:predicted small secreted protein